MSRLALFSLPLFALVLLAGGPARGDGPKGKAMALRLFEGGGMPAKGLWKLEILESSNPEVQAKAAGMSMPAMCFDMTGDPSQILKAGRPGQEGKESSCKQEVVTNNKKMAELKIACADGTSKVKISRETERSVVFEWWHTPRQGAVEHMKMRQSYQGECKEGTGATAGAGTTTGVPVQVQLDPNSDACKAMRAQMGPDPMAKCAGVPAAQRGGCEAQINQVLSMCSTR